VIPIVSQSLEGARVEALKQGAARAEDKEGLREACRGFEAIMLSMILKSMRETVPEDGLLGQSHGMDIFRSMQDQALAEELSRSGRASGLGEMLYRSLQDSVP
jgi:flagellar protein FlgJ